MKIRAFLLVVASLAIGVAACTNDGSGDDDDDGASPSPSPTATGVTDRIHFASGIWSPLIESLPSTLNSVGFQLSATLGTSFTAVTNGGEQSWACFAPNPPDFPDYDLVSFRTSPAGNYYYKLSVPVAQWSVGNKTIDGTSVKVWVGNGGVDFATIYGMATGGTVTISSAGTVADSGCAFTMSDVPVLSMTTRGGPT